FFFSSRRRHTRFSRDWSSDVCSSDVAAEYLVIFLYLCALVLLARRLRHRAHFNVPLLMAALGLTIFSELLFTSYFQVTDLFNLMGHAYKVLAYLMLRSEEHTSELQS